MSIRFFEARFWKARFWLGLYRDRLGLPGSGASLKMRLDGSTLPTSTDGASLKGRNDGSTIYDPQTRN